MAWNILMTLLLLLGASFVISSCFYKPWLAFFRSTPFAYIVIVTTVAIATGLGAVSLLNAIIE